MSKIGVLNSVADLTQVTTAQATINGNYPTITSALQNTLSLDGSAPNQMQSNLDMNSNQILNLPSPATTNSPARLIDVTSNPTIIVPPVGTSGAVVPLLNANNTWSGVQTFTATPSVPALTVTGATSGAVTIDTANAVASGTVLVPNGPATLLSTAGVTKVTSAGNPAGTTSTTGVMMGLGSSFTLTPAFSTRIIVFITGNMANNTANGGAGASMRFGTGTAPVNGAAPTGTGISGQSLFLTDNANTANLAVPTTVVGIATGLTPGTTYWFDIDLLVLSVGTATFQNTGFEGLEI